MTNNIIHIAAASLALALATTSLTVQSANAAATAPSPAPAPAPTSTSAPASAPAASGGGGSSAVISQVCFFTEAEFSGAFYCEAGMRGVLEVKDQWRDRIKSVSIAGNTSVVLCNEFNREGFCVTLKKSEPELAPQLRDSVYSYRIR